MFQALKNEIDKIPEQKVISIIGAGGKTTVMYALANAFAMEGKKTLVTTTTHIYEPDGYKYVDNLHLFCEQCKKNKYAVVGKRTKGGKLKSLEQSELKAYMEEAEVVLIEADGAKGLPCKVSNTTEPVIIEETNVLIMVLGLDALGKRMRDVCFRCELAMDLLGVDRDHVMKEEDFVTIIRNQIEEQMEGYTNKWKSESRKCLVVLNKCDTKKRRMQGERIANILEKDGDYRVYIVNDL